MFEISWNNIWKNTLPSLAICIPTYNRAELLAELLESIIAQGNADLEVVVSDDASPEDPSAVVESFRSRIPRLRYIRQPVNIGLDRNFLAVVEAAESDYIWLMGDDDVLEPGSAKRVLDALEAWPGVSGLTLGVIDYDFTMSHPTGVRSMPRTQRVDGMVELFTKIPDLLGFMSALVVDRRKWLSIAHDPIVEDFRNYYIQVYIIGRVSQLPGGWGILKSPCVRFRTSNDQFLSKLGWLKRLEVDVVGYEQIADALLDETPVAKRIMRGQIFDTHVMARLRNAKTQPGPTPKVGEAISLLFDNYRDLPQFWTRALPTLLTPGFAVRIARSAYQKLSRNSGTARAKRISTEFSGD
jgi:abequosyltransferase